MQYLAARYENGKVAVENLLQTMHRYCQLPSGLVEGQSDLLQDQGNVGKSLPLLAVQCVEHLTCCACCSVIQTYLIN